jgi:predicted phosphoadenosine phosphosulfate sulfurtransferase
VDALTDRDAADQAAVRPTRLLLGKEPLGTDVHTAALDRVREAYHRFDHVCVSFSGGKDSTAVLNVALEVAREDPARLPLRVVFFDEECISYQTEAYVRRVAQRPDVDLEWWCLPVQHRNACDADHPHWWPWAPEAEHLWVRPMPPEALTRLEGFPVDPPAARWSIPDTAVHLLHPFDRYGHTAQLMGIRSDESLVRRRSLAWVRDTQWIVPKTPAVANVYPVYDWSTSDVWTAPKLFGWDRNATYDVMEMAGIGHHAQRCAPPFGEEPIRDLWMWQACFPELWERMSERVPGAAAAARYSRTELYGYGGQAEAEKPPGMSWPEYLREVVLSHDDPKVRAFIATKLQHMLGRHHRMTTEPLMAHAKHPVSGMSWASLVAIARRGDTKNRKEVMQPPGRDAFPRLRRAYDAERAEVEAGG